MRALLEVEARRMLARPLLRAFAIAAVSGSLVAGAAVGLVSHKSTPAQVQSAEVARQLAIEECVSEGFNSPATQATIGDRREFCENEVVPAVGLTFELRDVVGILEGVDGKGSAAPLVIVSLLLGASFVGAEWRSRGLQAQLGWEPRRMRMLAAKVAVAALAVFGASLLAQAILVSALVPAAVFRGTAAGGDVGWILTVGGTAFRVASLCALAGVAGASLAMIGRSTAAALGAVVLYGLVEVFVRGFEDPAWVRWLAGENGGLFVVADSSGALEMGRSTGGALVVLAAYNTVLFVVAVASFRTRDVA